MILDVPTGADFEEQGLSLLNLAWDNVFDLLIEHRDAEEWQAIVDEEQSEEYWNAAQRPLAIATALTQQGAEFLVKAKIAAVSPYLLLTGTASAWPRRCDKDDTPFSAFKVADAQDLIRIHDTVISPRLSNEFVDLFSRLRTVRNTVFHSVDKTRRFSEKDLIETIQRVVHELKGGQAWMMFRQKYLETVPSSVHSIQAVGYRLSREGMIAIELLTTSQLKTFFGFDKRQRSYICPECASNHREVHSETLPDTAQLSPNSPTSRAVWCFVCRVKSPVERRSCSNKGCRGNVICTREYARHECLTCFEPNVPEA